MNAPFDQLSTWLKEHKITEVECVISDLTGIARGKIAPTNSSCMSEACACRKVCCCKR